MLKKHFSIVKLKKEIKTSATGLKNELNYSLMSEGNTCIAERNLEVTFKNNLVKD